MQKIILKLSLLTLLFFGLLVACTEEGGVRIPEEMPTGPTISLVAGPNQISSDATVPAGGTFTVQVSAQAGEAFLDIFSITRNGSNVPFDQLQFDQSDIAANPVLIINNDYKTSINWVIQITTDGSGAADTYTFTIQDENNQTASTSILIAQESAPPSLQFLEEAPYFWEDKTCPPDTRFTVRVLANKGTATLQTVSIFEDGLLITDLMRIQINGFDLFNNPTDVATDSRDGFDWEISIQTASDFGTKNYEIVVADENGQTASVALNVTTGTTVTVLSGKLLLNQAGPVGTGGINLLTGDGTGSSDANAHLKDEGIDTDLPVANNWKQQISGANGSVIRTLGSDQPETFDYDNILLSEQIVELFVAGQDLTLTNGAGEAITEKIEIGAILLVQNGENHFAVRVDDVSVSPSDNADFYELSIKH